MSEHLDGRRPGSQSLWRRTVLSELRSGRSTPLALEAQVGEGLAAGCAGCREQARELAEVVAALSSQKVRSARSFEEPDVRGRRRLATVGDPLLVETAVARLRSLRGWARRRELVFRQHHHYRGALVARAILAEARKALPGEPEEAAHWAQLVSVVVGFGTARYCADDDEEAALVLRAGLFVVNAARCRGDLEEAERFFRKVAHEAAGVKLLDPAFWAEFRSFSAALRRAQRDFPTALREARFSAQYAAADGDGAAEARAFWQIATIHEQLGEPKTALAAIREALSALADAPDAELLFNVRHAEAAYLARCGHFAEAAAAFAALAPEYALYPWKEEFRQWLEGLISYGLGQSAEARAAFRAARDGFLGRGNPYDAALVTLDWSLLLLDEGQAEEVLPLAVAMGQQFERLGVARETLASWAILRSAAERHELSRGVAEALVRALGTERSGLRWKS